MITITENKIYLLIQQMKEYLKVLKGDDTKTLMKRHKIKTQIYFLEQILKDGNLDTMIDDIKNQKNSIIVRDEIVKEESGTSK